MLARAGRGIVIGDEHLDGDVEQLGESGEHRYRHTTLADLVEGDSHR